MTAADQRSGGTARFPTSRRLLRQTAPGGLGLLLVNVGYVSVLAFGAGVARAHHTGLQTLIVPLFAAAVIVSRTIGGGVPDRLGARRTVIAFAGAEALGLLVYANAIAPALALAALLTLSIGQSLAVPGLGLLALSRVPAAAQGSGAGLFFAWFDAGVGIGGLTVGAVASAAGPTGALDSAAAAVATVALATAIAAKVAGPSGDLRRTALTHRRRRPGPRG
jgi:MFS family permease